MPSDDVPSMLRTVGFRAPSPANAEVFDRAVAEVTDATRALLADLRVGARG